MPNTLWKLDFRLSWLRLAGFDHGQFYSYKHNRELSDLDRGKIEGWVEGVERVGFGRALGREELNRENTVFIPHIITCVVTA